MNGTSRPRIHQTDRGLSVIYNERHLYSRFDPAKNAVTMARQAVIPPETLVLCVSPLLGYGLDELLRKIPDTSHVLALECDENFMALSIEHIDRSIVAHPSFTYIRTAAIGRLLETIDSLPHGPFRRCLRLDFSGGADEYPEFYAEALSRIDEYLSRYWRNHLTMIKLGRNYARNLFRNLGSLEASLRLSEQSVDKPVLVAGAGPSLIDSLSFIRENRQSLCILAVDTALSTLRDSGIVPDAVVLVESQYWIEAAFRGFRDARIPVYADLTARNQAVKAPGGPLSFFFSTYARSTFIDRFIESGLAPTLIPPLGSVGLVALHLADLLAQKKLPIFFTGLDFSWGNGFTHARGSAPILEIHNIAERLNPPLNGLPATRGENFTAPGKHGSIVRTDVTLSGYAQLCAVRFSDRCLDIGKSGLSTGCPSITETEARSLIESLESLRSPAAGHTPEKAPRTEVREAPGYGARVRAFLEAEERSLRELKSLLTGESGLATGDVEERTAELIQSMDYLYLHFPDGYRGYSGEANFLRRVRIELEYFLKTITQVTGSRTGD